MPDYDDSPDKSPGATRRTFLAGTAAALGLPALGSTATASTSNRATITHGNAGTHRAAFPSHDGLWSSFDLLYQEPDKDTSIDVDAYWYDDEENDDVGGIEMTVASSTARMTLDFTPDRARDLAADLTEAAEQREQGRWEAQHGDD